MTLLAGLSNCILQTSKSFLNTVTINTVCVRYASKKSSTSTRNKPIKTRPKHRGWRVQDGHFVQEGTILVKQISTRFHPGLYVGFGRDGTLYALEKGKVMVTCEKIKPNMEHSWVRKSYAGRENSTIYKKFFNIIPEPQHDRFKLIDTI